MNTNPSLPQCIVYELWVCRLSARTDGADPSSETRGDPIGRPPSSRDRTLQGLSPGASPLSLPRVGPSDRGLSGSQPFRRPQRRPERPERCSTQHEHEAEAHTMPSPLVNPCCPIINPPQKT